jgi:hypothetical protein
MSVRSKTLWSLLVVLAFSTPMMAQTPAGGRATRTALPDDESGPGDVVTASPAIAGTWRSTTERLPLLSDFDVSVYGKNAVSERTVDVTIKATGEGLITVSRRVLDAQGRVVKGSASIEEASFKVGAAQPALAGRIEHAVEVTHAERRYPDDPTSKWPLDGTRVTIASFADDRATLEVRFDTPDGRGSLAELVQRQRPATRRAAR